MNVNTVLQLATLVSVIVGIVGLWIAVRSYRRQVTTQVLVECARRHDEIICSRVFLREWKQFGRRFEGDREFHRYVEAAQRRDGSSFPPNES